MKQKDLIIIIVAVFISGVLSFFVSNKLFTIPADRQAEVPVVEPISAQFTTPDPRYYNAQSYNPTELIKIGENENTAPFSAGQ